MHGATIKTNITSFQNPVYCSRYNTMDIMILGKWPTWHTILFYVFIFIFDSLHVSSTSYSSSGETNCINSSGSCHSVSVAVSSADDMATDTEWQLPEVVFIQFVSPDDGHDVLEKRRGSKIKINA